MPKFFKKFILSFLSFLILFFSVAPNLIPVKAAATATWYDQSFLEWFPKVYDQTNPSEIFGERYTAAQVQWVVWGLISFLIPDKPVVACIMSSDLSNCPALKDLGIATNTNAEREKEGLASLIFSSDRPFSGISYVKGRIQNFSLIPVAHAQTVGFGFQQLSIIQELWTSVRNTVYGLFVLMAIILSFMIMFRVKIAPQVVISIQSAIPKLILALVLVTFSYAIAGFIVDLMYVIIGLFSLMLANSGSFFAKDPTTIFKFLTTGYVGLNSSIGLPLGIFGLFAIYAVLFPIILLCALFSLNGGIATVITAVFSLGTVPALIVLISIIAFVILSIILLFNFFKIVWMLIKTFAQFLLITIFGPFQIALGVVIPGMGFGSWLKSLAASLAVFPTTGLLLAMSFVFLKLAGTAANNAFNNVSWWDLLGILPGGLSIANAQLANGWPPLLNGPRGMLSLIYLGVSLVLITLIPKTVEVIQGIITGRPFAYGSAIGEAFGPVRWAGNQAWNQTGARDIWELAQLARKSRIMESWIGENKPGRPYVERFVGGGHDEASSAISNAQKKYRDSTGRADEV